MVELKNYQQRAIEKLKEYLSKIKVLNEDHETAYLSILNKESESVKYHNSFDCPFVCIKIPTGGGKTIVACESVSKIMSELLQEKFDKGIVMWFVPSDAIKVQTLKKLNEKKDMHRQILENYFGKNIKIFSNEEALRIKKSDIEDNLCIIVSVLDAFRKEGKLRDKYKVYQENGALLDNFEDLQNIDEKILDKDESGIIKSLANVIKINNPLILIDEGHRAKTSLSIDFLKNLNPSFILEFTATPRVGSNILVNTHSQELKNENMVKIPLVLESKKDWSEVIDDGFLQRKELEKLAEKEDDYLRPIALFQAEPDRDERSITVEKIKSYLMKEKKINEDEIAIRISGKDELEKENLFSKKCKIRYIITINALAEGWDCSFAYVLVSVSNLGSKIAVEQILGRIMRMPYAKRRKNDSLNKSYVFASARNFQEAANQIIGGLEENGYSSSDIVSFDKKEEKSPFSTQARFKEEVEIPLFSVNNEELSFSEHLIGEEFDLSKQDYKINFILPMNEDARGEIDLTEKGDWKSKINRQLTLNFAKNKKSDLTEKELVFWLDEKIRFSEISKEEKIVFLQKAVNYLLENKIATSRELSLYRYKLKETIESNIENSLNNFAKQNFDNLLKTNKIKLEFIRTFPKEIELTSEINQEYKKSYYNKVEKLNKEEKSFLDKLELDELENIKFWIRCREKQEDSFGLRGWEDRRFYPDFLAVTDRGNILAIEWKGEHLEDSKDTEYKKQIGEIWQKLGKGKLYFFLATNKNSEEILRKIKPL